MKNQFAGVGSYRSGPTIRRIVHLPGAAVDAGIWERTIFRKAERLTQPAILPPVTAGMPKY